ncbi:hypothetical protein DPX16_10237 [Anabarilius grahami]|uniref:Uncharacterized protein n=1 Tax=Anabarilius grahami TaxID=495550 RepID=A0A3N0Y244_ANAGA|nr:hypothetical protein DPX16_10237 [Anabarilius grahami]
MTSYGATRKYKGAPGETVFISSSFGPVLSDCIYTNSAAAADKDELLDDDDVLSLMSSDPGASALLAASPREQEMALEEEAGEPAAPSRPPCPAYAELLEIMERASGRLQLPWERVRKTTGHGRLDEWFLSDHNPITPVSLPFLPDLHVEIDRAWKNLYSARIHRQQQANFADVEELSQNGGVGKLVVKVESLVPRGSKQGVKGVVYGVFAGLSEKEILENVKGAQVTDVMRFKRRDGAGDLPVLLTFKDGAKKAANRSDVIKLVVGAAERNLNIKQLPERLHQHMMESPCMGMSQLLRASSMEDVSEVDNEEPN